MTTARGGKDSTKFLKTRLPQTSDMAVGLVLASMMVAVASLLALLAAARRRGEE